MSTGRDSPGAKRRWLTPLDRGARPTWAMKPLMRVLAVALLSSCIPSPAELCHRGVDLECTRQFECQSDAVKASEGFRGGYGTSVEDCKLKVAAQAGCDDKATQDALCTGADEGKKFDLSKASACSSERKALTCADFLDPAKLPAACKERCR